MSAVLEERTIEPAEVPHALSLVVPVTSEMTQAIKPIGAVIEAEAWVIDCADMAQLAADQRTAWARRVDAIKQIETDFMKPAKTFMDSIKGNCAKWFGAARLDLETGREIIGGKLLVWDQAEKARVEAEQRKIRQEAEAKAAVERARAEEQARAQRAKEQEALEAQRKAIAEGNAKAAAAAAAAAAKANEAAQAAIENGQAKAQQAELEAAARAFAAPEAVKIAGSSVRENWVAVLVDGYTEDKALLAICKAIATGRSELLPLVKVDTAARGSLNKLAAALKGAMNVPGYVAKNNPTLSGARK